MVDAQPLPVHELARLTGMDRPTTERTVARLAGAGLLDLDGAGAIIGAHGLTLAEGRHRLYLGGTDYSTWCAYDAFGIPAALIAALMSTLDSVLNGAASLVTNDFVRNLKPDMADRTLDQPKEARGLQGYQLSFEHEHYEISRKIGELNLLPAVREADDRTLIVTEGFSCREQIRQDTPRNPLHLAEVLSLAINATEPWAQARE